MPILFRNRKSVDLIPSSLSFLKKVLTDVNGNSSIFKLCPLDYLPTISQDISASSVSLSSLIVSGNSHLLRENSPMNLSSIEETYNSFMSNYSKLKKIAYEQSKSKLQTSPTSSSDA